MMVPSRHARQRERLSSASSKASTIATAYTRQSITSRQTTRNRSQRPRKVEPVSTKTGEAQPAAWACDRPAEPGLVRRYQCAAASGVRDGGWPPATGLQEQVANRRKRRGSKARVVSVTEKASERRQVGDRKANTSELPSKCRKQSDEVETGE